MKSSGLCVSTGTGSTSWYKSINSISPLIVQEILRLFNEKEEFSNQKIEKICSTFNNSLQFNAGMYSIVLYIDDCYKIFIYFSEELKLCYSIRDMIVTERYDNTPKYIHPRGFCNKLTIRSQCFDASIVIDGGIAVPFNFGTTAVLETFPEDSLRALTLSD